MTEETKSGIVFNRVDISRNSYSKDGGFTGKLYYRNQWEADVSLPIPEEALHALIASCADILVDTMREGASRMYDDALVHALIDTKPQAALESFDDIPL